MNPVDRELANFEPATSASDYITSLKHQAALLRVGVQQTAIFNSALFSCIATDAAGTIQIFNVGAERMLGYAALDVLNETTPADICDRQELVARAAALSLELDTPITAGFEALVIKASAGIEDIYELTFVRKDGSRFPAIVSVTALRDAQDAIIGFLLISTNNTGRWHAQAPLTAAIPFRDVPLNRPAWWQLAKQAISRRALPKAKDILIWPDGFWCFREEFRSEFLRDNSYRVVPCGSAEWALM